MAEVNYQALSDEALNQIASGKVDYSKMSDQDLAVIAGEKSVLEPEPSFLQRAGQSALETVGEVGQFVDKFTGAPARAAIGAAQRGEDPIGAFGSHFGEDPSKAPTGREIVKRAGVSDKPIPLTGIDLTKGSGKLPLADIPQGQQKGELPSPASILGFGVDVVADPLALVPGTALAKLAARGTKGVIKGGAKLATKGATKTAKALTPVTVAEKAVSAKEIAKTVGKNASRALDDLFRPVQKSDFPSIKKTAEKHGIDPKLLPESVEFGEQSATSRLARSVREGPLGQKRLEDFQKSYAQVNDAIERQIQKVGRGPARSPVEAGAIIEDGFQQGIGRAFDQADVTHDFVNKSVPGLKLTEDASKKLGSKLNGIEKWAKGKIARGATPAIRAQAKQILENVQFIRNSNGSYHQTLQQLREIGEVAFKGKGKLGTVPADIQKFRELYFTTSEALIDTTRKTLGNQVADDLLKSNKILSDTMNDLKQIQSVIKDKNTAAENIFRRFVSGGDTKKIELLRKHLTPEQLQQVKGAFLDSLVKRDPSGAFPFRSLHNAMRTKRSTIEALFSPEEIRDFAELVKLGDSFGPSVLSTSGTGASNAFRGFYSRLTSLAGDEAALEALKKSARKRSAKQAGAKLTPSPKSALGKMDKIAAKSPITLRPSNLDEALKASQVFSVQQQDQKKKNTEAIKRRLRGN